jgi:type I restriction enzyme, S subunit
MSDLPHGWVEASFGDLFDFRGGSQPPKSEFIGKKEDGYVRLLQIRDFESDAKAVFIRDASRWPKCNENDIMVGRYGASVGKILSGKAGAYNVALVKMIFDRELLECEWVRRYLLSDHFQRPLQQISRSAQNGFNKEDLEGVFVPLPPAREQRRIVAKIDSLSAKSCRARGRLDHLPRLVEKYKRAILAAAYQGGLSQTDDRRSRTVRLENFVEALDQGWSPKCESDPALNGEWAVIKTTAIQPVAFSPGENKKLPSELTPRSQLALAAGDVLITRAGPRSRVAICCLVREDHPKLMLCDKAYRLRLKHDRANPAFVTYMLNAPQSQTVLEKMKTGINDSGLNLTQAKFLGVPMPDFALETQRAVVERLETAFAWINRVTSDTTRARRLVDHLDQAVLAKALRGELVPQDPSDEPASVLLERIRADRTTSGRVISTRRRPRRTA